MRPRPDARVYAWAEAQPGFALSVITLEEIQYGLALRPSARMEAWFSSFLDTWCEVIPVSVGIARRAAAMRATARARGASRTQADMLIAATAWEQRLVLVTRNTADFEGTGIRILDPFRG